MRANGVRRYAQLLSDLFVGIAEGQLAQDVQLAVAQLETVGVAELDIYGMVRIDMFSGNRTLYYLAQRFLAVFLVPEALDPDLMRIILPRCLGGRGREDDPDLRLLLLDLPRGSDAVDPRAHQNVQNHEIDRMIQAERDGVARVGKRSRKRIANVVLNHHFKKRAGDTVIVDHNDLIFLFHQIHLIYSVFIYTIPSLLYTFHPRLTSSLWTIFEKIISFLC